MLDVEVIDPEVFHGLGRHQYLGRGDIAQQLELPVVPFSPLGHSPRCGAAPNLLAHIREEEMTQLMCNAEANPAGRTRWVVLHNQVASFRIKHRSSIRSEVRRTYAGADQVSQLKWIIRGAVPTPIDASKHQVASSRTHLSNRITLGRHFED